MAKPVCMALRFASWASWLMVCMVKLATKQTAQMYLTDCQGISSSGHLQMRLRCVTGRTTANEGLLLGSRCAKLHAYVGVAGHTCLHSWGARAEFCATCSFIWLPTQGQQAPLGCTPCGHLSSSGVASSSASEAEAQSRA